MNMLLGRKPATLSRSTSLSQNTQNVQGDPPPYSEEGNQGRAPSSVSREAQSAQRIELADSSSQSQNTRNEEDQFASEKTADGPPREDFRDLLRYASLKSKSPGSSIARVRLVIGIDFGTTFSGVAYAVVQPNADPINVRVTTIRDWPGRGPNGNRAVANKVPTLIAFDHADGDEAYWGYDIPPRLRGKSIKHIKLLLEPDVARHVSSVNDIIDPEATQRYLGRRSKSAVAVASTYVRLLWEHAKSVIIEQMGHVAYQYAEKVVLFSVPAVWSERAKHNTYMLAVEAGLAHKDYQLHMVSEPEAAAIAVLNDPIRVAQLKRNDVYMVVDAGGGTVDLTSYKISATRPLQLEEVVAGDGAVCGAAFLEANFRELLKNTFGADVIESLDPFHYERIINDWENNIRDPYTGDDEWRYALITPGLSASGSKRIIDGMVHFTANEIRPVFAPIINQIKSLIATQISTLEGCGMFPKAIILVGGLGCNSYLASRLKHAYEDTVPSGQKGRISVIQPDFALESVAQGAVKCDVLGLGSVVSLRIARYNLGYFRKEKWDSEIHLPEQKYLCEFTDEYYAKNAMKWHIRRNSKLKPDDVVEFEMCYEIWESTIDGILSQEKGDKILELPMRLSASGDDEELHHPSPSTRAFAKLTAFWDLTAWPKENSPLYTSPKGTPYRILSLDVQIVQSMAGLKFNLYIGGELCGEVDVNFLSIPEAIENGRAFARPPTVGYT